MSKNFNLPSHCSLDHFVIQPFPKLQQSQIYLHHDAFSSGCLEKAALDRNVYMTANYICPEARALLVAVESLAARRAEAQDAGGIAFCLDGDGGTLQRTSVCTDEMYDPERILLNMAPPKKYYKTFWKSVSLRLLHRWAQMSLPPPEKGPWSQVQETA